MSAKREPVFASSINAQPKASRSPDPIRAYCRQDVCAPNLAGIIHMDHNVSKGVITTSGVFAPNLEKDELIQKLLPYRLGLRPRDILIPWLKKLGGR
jgi:hypothetical protein